MNATAPAETGAPGAPERERKEHEHEQDDAAGSCEDGHGRGQSDQHEATGGRPLVGARDGQCEAGKCRCEHRLAGQLVEHKGVAVVEQECDGGDERYAATEDERGATPRHDRERVEHRQYGLDEEAAREVEHRSGDKRRDRRPEEQRPRQQHVAVEELEVGVDVLVEVPAHRCRPGDGPKRVGAETDHEEDSCAATRLR